MSIKQNNLLTRGQEIAVEVDEAKAVAMPLQPGEISLHNVRLAHASGPNRSKDRRIGLSMHYMPTRTKQTVGEWDSAALVRGTDRFGHFKQPLRVQLRIWIPLRFSSMRRQPTPFVRSCSATLRKYVGHYDLSADILKPVDFRF